MRASTSTRTARQPGPTAPPPPVATRPTWLRVLARNWMAVAFYAALVGFWELAARAGWVADYLLPAPSRVVSTLGDNLDLYLQHSWITLVETVLGFGLGSLTGLVLGLSVAYSRPIERLVYPGVIFTQTVPKLALAPLFTVWFGVGLSPKVLITALICLFPVLINTVVGVRSVDPRLRQLMSSVSANPWQTFSMIDLPTALPHIFGGLQVGVTLAVVGAIVGEWVGSDKGLGYLIIYDNSQLRTAEVFASLLCVTLLGILLFLAVRWLERLLLPHHVQIDPSAQREP